MRLTRARLAAYTAANEAARRETMNMRRPGLRSVPVTRDDGSHGFGLVRAVATGTGRNSNRRREQHSGRARGRGRGKGRRGRGRGVADRGAGAGAGTSGDAPMSV